jgi:hypothetical protein
MGGGSDEEQDLVPVLRCDLLDGSSEHTIR